jgi:ribonuclease P protein subunit POP4
MAVTAETLARHELVGLPVEVAAASNDDVVGVAGTVVGETTNTLAIESEERVWHVPKEGATFAFDLGAAPDVASEERVRIDGARLVARPARRTETSGDSTWP